MERKKFRWVERRTETPEEGNNKCKELEKTKGGICEKSRLTNHLKMWLLEVAGIEF
jgi:hypothetical protein